MSYVKNYNVGEIQLDLPTSNYFHELPLLSFADIHGEVNLSLVFNYGLKAEGSNPFNITTGYKLNMQKRLIMSNNAPIAFQNESGKVINLNSSDTRYAFDDDSQRIIRRTGSTYELENLDFSKEIYDQVGKIKDAYDKYGTLILSYAYNSGGILTSITYRNEKTITFTYDSSNRLKSIAYSGKTISLTYTTSGIKLNHYTGVKFTLSSSGMEFSAIATATENSTTVSYTTKIEKDGDDVLAVSNLMNSSIINTTTYKFPGSVASYSTNFLQVEITDHYGARKRIQFQEDKPLYSYEIGTSDAEFNNDKYSGTVQIHSVFNSSNLYAGGEQSINDGSPPLTVVDTATEVSCEFAFPESENYEGLYVLSGWIKLIDNSTGSAEDTLPLTIAEDIFHIKFTHNLPKAPVGQWSYFAVGVPVDQASFCAYIKKCYGNIEIKDIRLTFQTPCALSEGNTTNLPITEDVLIYHGRTAPVYLPIRICNFSSDSLDISSYGKVFFEDLLKYKINQRKNRHLTEFYLDKARTVLTTSPSSLVTVRNNTNTYSCNLKDCYLGKRSYTQRGTIITRIRDDASGAFFVMETIDEDYNIISSQTLDSNLDVVSVKSNGVTTSYERNNDLVISERVGDMYTRTTAYAKDSSNNPTITATDEFGKKTVHTLDPAWGVVTSVLMPDGTKITDEYDDGRGAITKRKFGNSNDYSIMYGYDKGNLTSLQIGALNYAFTYARGNLTSAKKCGDYLESHDHYDTYTNSYYPSKINKVYQNTINYDKYGRVVSIGNEISNVYNTSPEFDSSGNIVSKPDNASSLLAMSTDNKINQVARYEYNNNKTLKKKTVTGTSFSNKVSEETFTYDAIKRMKSHSCTYNVSNSKSVSEHIYYVKGETDPSADNRIYSYEYKVNGVRKAYSYNNYDAYNRLIAKATTVGHQGLYFTRDITYDKTRVSRVADSFSSCNKGTDIYEYDSLGRITSHCYSSDYTCDCKTYVYNSFGQLVREDNIALDKTFIFCYDSIGNITSVKTYAYTTDTTPSGAYTEETYCYDSTHKDRLVNFNGNCITYNSLGCPQEHDGKIWSWTKGKLTRIHMGSASQPGSTYEDCTFSYDAYGRRTQKHYVYDPNPAVAGDGHYYYTTDYTYDASDKLIREVCTEYRDTGITTTREFIYLYDESGIIGVTYNANGSGAQTYFYRRNLQGDVIAIYDQTGSRKVEYAYDAFGNCTVVYAELPDLANSNPIRYRGYYYDRETKLYYLNARYYNPEWRRFISPDSTEYIDPENPNGLNLYAYCYNDPVNYKDPSGHSVIITTALILLGVGVVTGLGYATYTDYRDDYDINGSVGWQTYVGSAIFFGTIGFLIGCFGPSILSFLGSSFSFTLPALGTFNMGGILALGGGATITITGTQIVGGAAVALGAELLMFARTPKRDGYYGERWPGDPHKPDHVHLRGNDTDIRIGRNGNPLPGEKPLDAQARKALKKLWNEFLKLFNKW